MIWYDFCFSFSPSVLRTLYFWFNSARTVCTVVIIIYSFIVWNLMWLKCSLYTKIHNAPNVWNFYTRYQYFFESGLWWIGLGVRLTFSCCWLPVISVNKADFVSYAAWNVSVNVSADLISVACTCSWIGLAVLFWFAIAIIILVYCINLSWAVCIKINKGNGWLQ